MMRLLLDTNILVPLARDRSLAFDSQVEAAVEHPGNTCFASAASLWEIAIKTRLGKLDVGIALDDLATYLSEIGLSHLIVDHRHAVAEADPAPATRDPFDRLLLAQCHVEDMRLVTTDRALAVHPLAWRPT